MNTTNQKFGVMTIIFLFKTFILQGCTESIKSDIKDICNVTKDFYFK